MTMIHLLRHAHAGDSADWDGPDSTRPLTEKGRGQADRLGRFLAAQGFRPEVILTSPKVRAAQTAEIVAGHLGLPVGIEERLAGAVDRGTVGAILAEHGSPPSVVLVGHDPDFSDLLATLCGADIPMRKGALARIEADLPLEPGTAVLRWLVPPDLLRGDA
jgi:phosphohistidine phosphatase